jgi:hypothetical protein
VKFLLSFLALAALAWAEPRTLVLTGTVTNTTGDVTAPARLELTLDGETISARLVTSPPLTGTGVLTGRCLDGWCDLSGTVDGGFALTFRGVLNARDFRGTYTAVPPRGPLQYGRFLLAPAVTASPAK